MPLLNWEDFLERVDNNKSLALELAVNLLTAMDDRLRNVEAAFQVPDMKKVEQSSHALRGLLAPYGAAELLKALKSIEEQARHGTLELRQLPQDIYFMHSTLKSEVALKVEEMSESDDAN